MRAHDPAEERFSTYFGVPLTVIKRDGTEQPFSRQKLRNGMLRACEQRDIPIERIEHAVDEVEKGRPCPRADDHANGGR